MLLQINSSRFPSAYEQNALFSRFFYGGLSQIYNVNNLRFGKYESMLYETSCQEVKMSDANIKLKEFFTRSIST